MMFSRIPLDTPTSVGSQTHRACQCTWKQNGKVSSRTLKKYKVLQPQPRSLSKSIFISRTPRQNQCICKLCILEKTIENGGWPILLVTILTNSPVKTHKNSKSPLRVNTYILTYSLLTSTDPTLALHTYPKYLTRTHAHFGIGIRIIWMHSRWPRPLGVQDFSIKPPGSAFPMFAAMQRQAKSTESSRGLGLEAGLSLDLENRRMTVFWQFSKFKQNEFKKYLR